LSMVRCSGAWPTSGRSQAGPFHQFVTSQGSYPRGQPRGLGESTRRTTLQRPD